MYAKKIVVAKNGLWQPLRHGKQFVNLEGLLQDKDTMLMFKSVKVGINIECTGRVHWNRTKYFKRLATNSQIPSIIDPCLNTIKYVN